MLLEGHQAQATLSQALCLRAQKQRHLIAKGEAEPLSPRFPGEERAAHVLKLHPTIPVLRDKGTGQTLDRLSFLQTFRMISAFLDPKGTRTMPPPLV